MGSLAYDHVQNHTTGSFRPGTIPSVAATSSASNFDSDAEVFFTAAGITDATQKSAVNILVLGLKSNSIWTKMRAIYPFVGGSAGSHAVNLKSPGTYNITWSGTVTHSSTGVQGNGSTGYGDTGLNPRSLMVDHSAHISAYLRTDSAANDMEVAGGDGTYALLMRGKWTDNIAYGYNNSRDGIDAAKIAAANNPSSAAMYVSSRNTRYDGAIYRNGVAGSLATDNVGWLQPNANMYVLARNNAGTAVNYSSRSVAFISIGDGLTATDVSNLYTLVQAYQTTLGRQV